MKTFIISYLVLQILYYPLFVHLLKKGFVHMTFKTSHMILNALIFLMILFTSFSHNIFIPMCIFAIILIDEFSMMNTITNSFDKIFNHQSAFAFQRIPLWGPMNIWQMHKEHMATEWVWAKIVFKSLKSMKSPLDPKRADFLAKHSFPHLNWYEFLYPGNYGQQIIISGCLISIVILL